MNSWDGVGLKRATMECLANAFVINCGDTHNDIPFEQFAGLFSGDILPDGTICHACISDKSYIDQYGKCRNAGQSIEQYARAATLNYGYTHENERADNGNALSEFSNAIYSLFLIIELPEDEGGDIDVLERTKARFLDHLRSWGFVSAHEYRGDDDAWYSGI